MDLDGLKGLGILEHFANSLTVQGTGDLVRVGKAFFPPLLKLAGCRQGQVLVLINFAPGRMSVYYTYIHVTQGLRQVGVRAGCAGRWSTNMSFVQTS